MKRWRAAHPDRLSSLSHELLLRVLSFLPVPDLIVCQRYVLPDLSISVTSADTEKYIASFLSLGRRFTTMESSLLQPLCPSSSRPLTRYQGLWSTRRESSLLLQKLKVAQRRRSCAAWKRDKLEATVQDQAQLDQRNMRCQRNVSWARKLCASSFGTDARKYHIHG